MLCRRRLATSSRLFTLRLAPSFPAWGSKRVIEILRQLTMLSEGTVSVRLSDNPCLLP
jgi:hypothetical protein